MLDFDRYCELLKQWVKEGYLCIIDDKIREEIAQFENDLYNKEKLHDINAEKQRAEINKIITPIINSDEYNILEYYKRILQKYGIDEQYIEKFTNINNGVKLEAEAPTYRLYDEFIYGYEENNKAYNIMHPIVTDIINNIISVPAEPNISLSKSLEENPIVTCYERGKYSACMSISLIEGKERPTLIIRIPEDNIPDIDSLASTICHELGHWLDFYSKDFDNYYEARDLAECFADIIGAKLAQNAGYNFEKFIERITGFIEEFNTPEMQRYKNMAQKRYDLISKYTKKTGGIMTKFAYHCSANGEIEEFEPKISSHGKAYVYATPNKSLALVFGVKGHNDLWIHPCYNHENNTCTFIEMSPNALAKYYRNKRAYLYTVKRDEFTETTGWKGEICSPNPVKPLKVEYIEDLEQAILEEQNSGLLTFIPFEQRNNYGENMDEFFAKRAIIRLLKRNDEEYSQRYIQYMKSLENKEIFSFFKKELEFYKESFSDDKKIALPENITPIAPEFSDMCRNDASEKTVNIILDSIAYAPSKNHQQQIMSEVKAINNKELVKKIIFKLTKLNNIIKQIDSKSMETNFNTNTRE